MVVNSWTLWDSHTHKCMLCCGSHHPDAYAQKSSTPHSHHGFLYSFFLLRYIQAATSPKDIVIIVDVSGSMKGLRMTIAKHTIVTILDTLGENDFVNIIAVSMSLVRMHWCYSLPFQDPGHDENGLIIQREPAPINTRRIFP